MIVIYKIENPKGKVYIGQTKRLIQRKSAYKNLRCKKQRKLYSSLNKYGWENHTLCVLHELPDDIEQRVVDDYEIFYYEQFIACGFEMLNLKTCGNGGGLHSEETKRLIGKQSKERFKAKSGMKIAQVNLNLEIINFWENGYTLQQERKYYNISRKCREFPSIAYGYFWLYEKDLHKLTQIDKLKIKKDGNGVYSYFKM